MKRVIRLKESTILIKKFYFLLTLVGLLLTSCSTYIQYLENKDSQGLELKKSEEAPLYCSAIDSKNKRKHQKDIYNIIHESETGRNEFLNILQSLEKVRNFNIAELSLFYTLYNSIVRPDATNWNGRLQFYIHQDGQEYYYDFHENLSNFEDALFTFNKERITNIPMSYLLNMAKTHFPKKFTVQKKLSEFLTTNKDLLSHSKFKKYYRLDKALQKGETFSFNPTKFKPTYKSLKLRKPSPFFDSLENDHLKCNFDSKLYNSGIFIIHKDNIKENSFAIVNKNGDFAFITTSSGPITKAATHLGQSQVEVPEFNTPLCKYKDQSKEIITIASQTRDSGQLLHHLNQYKYYHSSNLNELIQYTSYARHLFLINPPRMLYESKRGTAKELNSFLSLNFPVYHASSIGQVQSIAKFGSDSKTYTYLQDERVKVYQSCLK